MKTRNSKYPIGKLLIKMLNESGLSIQPFVEAIGYGNSSKGVRAFDQILNYGLPNKIFLERLNASRFAPDPAELQRTLEESEAIVEREEEEARVAQKAAERLAFRPFVQGVPEYSTPTSISLFCFTGGHSRYTLPVPEDLPTWPPAEQHRHVKEWITRHFAASKGRTLWMGAITGYRLFRRYGEPAVLYSTEGEPVGVNPPSALPSGELSLGGKTLKPKELTFLIEPTPHKE